MSQSINSDAVKIFHKEKWNIEKREVPYGKSNALGKTSFNKSQIPSDYSLFIEEYSAFINAEDNAWFLMLEDFSEQSDSAFVWNEFETQSLDAALDDADEKKIKDFWNRHLPIFISVKDGYSFFAIEFREDNKNNIVFGREPEYEATSYFCDSFSDLLVIIINHISGKKQNNLLSDII